MGEAICELSIFCRICPSNCGPITSVDARAKLFRLLPDRANARTRGYTCFRGGWMMDECGPRGTKLIVTIHPAPKRRVWPISNCRSSRARARR